MKKKVQKTFNFDKPKTKVIPTLVLSVVVPEDGISLKVNGTNGFMLGTLNITPTGLKFVKVKAKKVPDRLVTWETLNKLCELGLS